MNKLLYVVALFAFYDCVVSFVKSVRAYRANLKLSESDLLEELPPDNKPPKIKWIMLFASFVFLVVMVLAICPISYAAELDVDYTDYESEDDSSLENERLNSMEIRLEELGYKINDMESAIESINESELAEQEERIVLSDMLEVVVIGINDLLNQTRERLEKQAVIDEQNKLRDESLAAYMASDTLATEQLTQLTVSGNSILTDFNTDVTGKIDTVSSITIEEFNKTLLNTNTLLSYLYVLLLVVLVMIIVLFIGSIIRNIINKSMF